MLKKSIKALLRCTIARLIATSSMAVDSALDGAGENEPEIQTHPVSETGAET